MTVITPCRPRLNATHSVCASTLSVLQEELARAARIVQPAAGGAGGAGASDAQMYAQLFEPADFFASYRGFVAVSPQAVEFSAAC